MFPTSGSIFGIFCHHDCVAVASLQSHGRVKQHNSTDYLVGFHCQLELGLAICYKVDWVDVSIVFYNISCVI